MWLFRWVSAPVRVCVSTATAKRRNAAILIKLSRRILLAEMEGRRGGGGYWQSVYCQLRGVLPNESDHLSKSAKRSGVDGALNK